MTDILPGGDGAATIDWAAQFEHHRPWLRKVLRCRVGDCHEVEDLLQEIALAVFRGSSRPSQPERVAPWLYRLAVRQAVNFHRRLGRKSNPVPRSDLDQFSIQLDPLAWIVAGEQQVLLTQAIERLGSVDREILMLKYTENWTYQQLAQHLGVKVRTVEYRLMRARNRLRRLLTQDTNTEPFETQPLHAKRDTNRTI